MRVQLYGKLILVVKLRISLIDMNKVQVRVIVYDIDFAVNISHRDLLTSPFSSNHSVFIVICFVMHDLQVCVFKVFVSVTCMDLKSTLSPSE